MSITVTLDQLAATHPLIVQLTQEALPFRPKYWVGKASRIAGAALQAGMIARNERIVAYGKRCYVKTHDDEGAPLPQPDFVPLADGEEPPAGFQATFFIPPEELAQFQADEVQHGQASVELEGIFPLKLADFGDTKTTIDISLLDWLIVD